MRVRTNVKAGGRNLNHNEKLVGGSRSDPAPQAQYGDPYPEEGDTFGWAVARGDFNGDGYQDQAVGLPSRTSARRARAPQGRSRRSTAARAGWLRRTVSSGARTAPPSRKRPNRETCSAAPWQRRLHGDGYSDLAIGVPSEDIGAAAHAGAVNVIYGSPSGLNATSVPDQLWTQAFGLPLR